LSGRRIAAMVVNDNACCLNERAVQTLFAGKPAPTGNPIRFCFSPLIRPSVSSPSALDLSAPSRGRAQVLRSGQPGMDAGLAAPGHGWPMAAGPRSRTGARAWRALARHRTKGARALGYLGLFQVTRRKGETISGRYRRNGYVHPHIAIAGKPAPTRTVYIRESRVACKAFASRLAPTGFVRVHPKKSPAKAGLKGCSSHAFGRLSIT